MIGFIVATLIVNKFSNRWLFFLHIKRIVSQFSNKPFRIWNFCVCVQIPFSLLISFSCNIDDFIYFFKIVGWFNLCPCLNIHNDFHHLYSISERWLNQEVHSIGDCNWIAQSRHVPIPALAKNSVFFDFTFCFFSAHFVFQHFVRRKKERHSFDSSWYDTKRKAFRPTSLVIMRWKDGL